MKAANLYIPSLPDDINFSIGKRVYRPDNHIDGIYLLSEFKRLNPAMFQQCLQKLMTLVSNQVGITRAQLLDCMRIIRYNFFSKINNTNLNMLILVQIRKVMIYLLKYKTIDDLLKMSPNYQDDKEIVLLSVKRYGFTLEDASTRLQDDKEVVMKAISGKVYILTSSALSHASPRLQDDYEVVMASVKNDGDSLRYASERLRDSRDIVRAAVSGRGYGGALRFANTRFFFDDEILWAAMRKGQLTNRQHIDMIQELKKYNKNYL